MPDKYTALTPELYAYAVEHGARQDDVLRRLADETERELGDVAIMQIAPRPGRLHDPAGPRDGGAAGARARHVHRLLGDLHRPRPARRRGSS